jgi:hypothetical protein
LTTIFLSTSFGVSKVTSVISCKVLQFNYITAYVQNYQLMFFVLERVFSCSVNNSDRGSWFQCCLIGYLIMLYQQQRVFVIKWNERKNRCNEPESTAGGIRVQSEGSHGTVLQINKWYIVSMYHSQKMQRCGDKSAYCHTVLVWQKYHT